MLRYAHAELVAYTHTVPSNTWWMRSVVNFSAPQNMLLQNEWC